MCSDKFYDYFDQEINDIYIYIHTHIEIYRVIYVIH